MMDGDEPSKSAMTHVVGMGLEVMSVEELNERIVLLQDEIDRVREEIGKKSKSRSVAESVFK